MGYALKDAVQDCAANRRPEDVLAARHKQRIARRRANGYRDILISITDLERLIEVALGARPAGAAI